MSGVDLGVVIRISPPHSPEPSPASQRNTSVSPTTQPPPLPLTKTQPDPPADMELEIPPSPPPLETTLAARRAKRLAIMAKYAGLDASLSPGPSSAVQPPPPTSSVSNPQSQTHSVAETPTIMSEVDIKPDHEIPSRYMRLVFNGGNLTVHVGRREAASMSPDPEDFALAKDHGEDEQIKEQAVQGDAEQVFAADYDPSLDRREDEQRRVRVANETLPIEVVEEEEEEAEIDDMFAVAMGEGKKVTKVKKTIVSVACNF